MLALEVSPSVENEIVFEAKEVKGFEAIDYEKLL
jgi:hypothetical protein